MEKTITGIRTTYMSQFGDISSKEGDLPDSNGLAEYVGGDYLMLTVLHNNQLSTMLVCANPHANSVKNERATEIYLNILKTMYPGPDPFGECLKDFKADMAIRHPGVTFVVHGFSEKDLVIYGNAILIEDMEKET